MFFNTLLDFAIVAFAIFLLIRQINRTRREAPATRCPHCTSQLTAA